MARQATWPTLGMLHERWSLKCNPVAAEDVLEDVPIVASTSAEQEIILIRAVVIFMPLSQSPVLDPHPKPRHLVENAPN